ncbi:MAG: polymer-forming cytoskeletal protein [Nitrosomonas sp.]|nr:polymer-forming cytoskeletal protein [Nitrosomonas sp.]
MFGKNKKGKQHGHIDTLIGTKTHVEGNINFSGGLRVDGHVCGNITATGDAQSTLVLSDQGNVDGKIQVANVVINGTVTGPIQADEYLELQAKAKVFGDVHYGSMEIQLGASVEGKLIRIDNVHPEKLVTLIPASSD